MEIRQYFVKKTDIKMATSRSDENDIETDDCKAILKNSDINVTDSPLHHSPQKVLRSKARVNNGDQNERSCIGRFCHQRLPSRQLLCQACAAILRKNSKDRNIKTKCAFQGCDLYDDVCTALCTICDDYLRVIKALSIQAPKPDESPSYTRNAKETLLKTGQQNVESSIGPVLSESLSVSAKVNGKIKESHANRNRPSHISEPAHNSLDDTIASDISTDNVPSLRVFPSVNAPRDASAKIQESKDGVGTKPKIKAGGSHTTQDNIRHSLGDLRLTSNAPLSSPVFPDTVDIKKTGKDVRETPLKQPDTANKSPSFDSKLKQRPIEAVHEEGYPEHILEHGLSSWQSPYGPLSLTSDTILHSLTPEHAVYVPPFTVQAASCQSASDDVNIAFLLYPPYPPSPANDLSAYRK